MKVLNIALFPALGIVLAGAATIGAQSNRIAKPSITVYKSSTCGCCMNWVDHMKGNGFNVTATDVPDIEVPKRAHGVPQSLESCHTGVIGGYVVEGHVPADVVQRMLREKPPIAGIAVPGMPIGSPGMEFGDQKSSYNIIAFDKAGKTSVYERR